MKDTDKVTLTLGQIKKLIEESKKTKNITEEMDETEWRKADKALRSTKMEIAKNAVGLYKQMREQFINKIGKMCIKNKISYRGDRPQDSAENMWCDIEDTTASEFVSDMYLYDD